MDKIIEVTNLRKNYGELAAVKDISFYVERGKLFSFLGPNGAGKSTTIDVLCTLAAPGGGEVRVDGLDLFSDGQAVRQRIGVVFQDGVLDDLLTVRENLTIRAGLYTSDRKRIKNAVHEAAAATVLHEFLDRPYGKLSGVSGAGQTLRGPSSTRPKSCSSTNPPPVLTCRPGRVSGTRSVSSKRKRA